MEEVKKTEKAGEVRNTTIAIHEIASRRVMYKNCGMKFGLGVFIDVGLLLLPAVTSYVPSKNYCAAAGLGKHRYASTISLINCLLSDVNAFQAV